MASVHIKNITLGEGLPKICVPLTDGGKTSLKATLNNMGDKHFDFIEWRVDKYEAFRKCFCCNASGCNTSGCNTSGCNDSGCNNSGCNASRFNTFGCNASDATANADAVCTSHSEAKNTTHNDTVLAPKSIDTVGIDLKKAAALIRIAFPDKPVIFTVRTDRDMEDFAISDDDYANVINYAAKEELCDIIDIEYSRGATLVARLVKSVQRCGLKTIVSRHIADHTPCEDAILNTLHNMQAVGADIVKYAAMPNQAHDVKVLMDTTFRYANESGSVPVITMSMGKLGVLSRICGSLTGSCLTFGTVGAASAPGQIDCEELWRILHILG